MTYRDNHYGPRFDDVKKAFPGAVRYHWHEDAYKPDATCWMVAYRVPCADGERTCNVWRDVFLSELNV